MPFRDSRQLTEEQERRIDSLRDYADQVGNALLRGAPHLWMACHGYRERGELFLKAHLMAARTDWLRVIDEAIDLINECNSADE